ncbi:MAG: MlaD family protein [Syntrophobacterales bacterium]|jgi:phospholipid/cholesterol/gamma-HCH transport system substrate-binding protein|nr:MlaD family protein [Syntrophobacterales bacterium]
MAKKSTNLILGAFVILGVVLGVIAVIWVGATSYFQKGETYISYFDESVQGLQMDSSVKFRGVDVGRVEQIKVAPDNRLIGVVMKINMQNNLQKRAIAQLKAAGITGIMFVDLDLRKPGEPDLSPKIDFPSEFPIIPTRPSEIQRLMTGINDIVQKFNDIDAKGISNQLIATTKAMEDFLKGKEMASIMTRLNASAGNLERLTGRADKVLADSKLDQTLAEARESLKNARTMLATVNDQILAMQLPATLGKTRDITRELQATSTTLRQSSETMEQLLQRLYNRPSDLLFGKPPKKRWNE